MSRDQRFGKIWITRSKAGAERSVDNWRAAGFESLTYPLVEIAPPLQMPPPIPDNAELLITSQNGLHSLLTLTDRRDWNVWAVGDVTAQLARNFGFKSVVSASGTGQDLLETVLGNKESEGPYIHLSGRDIRFDVAGALRAAGYTARRDIYYENNTVSDLSGVDLSPLTHIALYSPLAAQALVQSGVEAGHLTAVSISEAVDECLSGVKLKTRYVAKRPEESAMIAALCA